MQHDLPGQPQGHTPDGQARPEHRNRRHRGGRGRGNNQFQGANQNQGNRPPQHGNRPPFQNNNRPPFQNNNRPPFQGGGNRPPGGPPPRPPAGAPNPNDKVSVLNVHVPNAIELVSAQYATLTNTIREIVQNAIDAGATNVEVRVNAKTLMIRVTDNGVGLNKARFDQVAGQVCKSIKTDPADAGVYFGKRGMGLMAPLFKCKTYTIVSSPKNANNYIEWTMEQAKIKAGSMGIPAKPRPDLYRKDSARAQGAVTAVDWSTEVKLEGCVTTQVIGINAATINAIVEELSAHFGPKLKHAKCHLWVEVIDQNGVPSARTKVDAQEYSGQKLEEWIYDGDFGKVVFRLYFANRARIKDRVNIVQVRSFNEMDPPIPFKTFATQINLSKENEADAEIVQILQSGLFTGEIIAKVEVDPTREKFVVNDSLFAVGIAMIEWYTKVGYKQVEEINDRTRQDRRRENANKSSMAVKHLLKDQFPEILNAIEYGSVGRGHAKPNPKDEAGNTEPTQTPKHREHTPRGKDDSKSNPDDEKETKPRHVPNQQPHPEGQERTITKGKNQGPIVQAGPIADSDRPWRFEIETGRLLINTRHPSYERCEKKSDTTVQLYQEYIAVLAFTLQKITISGVHPPEAIDLHRVVLEQALENQTYMLIHADYIVGRVGGTRRKVQGAPAPTQG